MVISIRLSRTQEQRLRHLAKQLSTSRSELIRSALDAFEATQLSQRSGHPYDVVAKWIGCAKSGRGDLSARAHEYVSQALHARSRTR